MWFSAAFYTQLILNWIDAIQYYFCFFMESFCGRKFYCWAYYSSKVLAVPLDWSYVCGVYSLDGHETIIFDFFLLKFSQVEYKATYFLRSSYLQSENGKLSKLFLKYT